MGLLALSGGCTGLSLSVLASPQNREDSLESARGNSLSSVTPASEMSFRTVIHAPASSQASGPQPSAEPALRPGWAMGLSPEGVRREPNGRQRRDPAERSSLLWGAAEKEFHHPRGAFLPL